MKKILLLIISMIGLFSVFFTPVFGDCSFDETEGAPLSGMLNSCFDNNTNMELINSGDLEIGSATGFDQKIKSWTENIALYLGLIAVGAIVYGSLVMTLSGGEEDKIKKAKDIVKWGIIGFVLLISITAIINLIVRIMYSV